jgi:hypothetical protein
MGLRLVIGSCALAAAMVAGGIVAFEARASEHPRTEPSVAAGCVGCHMRDYDGARHHRGEKPTVCGACHAQTAWKPTRFEHPFELSGAHARAKCFECHTGSPARFHGTPNDCVDCHRAQYEAAPDHVGHFATTCLDCHGFEGWKPAHWTPPPPEPEPQPTLTATASTAPPPPKPPPKRPPVKPPPKPTASVPIPPPDVVTHPSRHEE